MNGSTDWLSAIGILLSGLVIGFMVLYANRRKGAAASIDDGDFATRLRDLEAERDASIQQLRELEDDPAAAPAERKRIEMRAAEALRAIDELRAHGEKPVPAGAATSQSAMQPGWASRNPVLLGYLYGVATMVAIGLIGLFVYKSATPRTEGAGLTGGGPPVASLPAAGPARQPSTSDAEVQRLEAAVAKQPDDVDRRIDLARAYLDRENMMGVFEQTKAVLDKHPDEPRAQTYNAIVRMSIGQRDEAKALLESATKKDPKLVDAWVALAWVDVQSGDHTKASEAIEEGKRNSPENAERLDQVWAQMQAQPPGAQQTAPGAQAAEAPPMMGAASGASAGAASGPSVHVTLQIAPSAARKSGIVFVVARQPGQSSGIPIAVKRLTASAFPIEVDLSSADSMMGQQLPASFSIEARLDSDGDPTTHAPDDPHAYVDRVSAGANLTLTLK